MKPSGGWNNKILTVDLSERRITEDAVDPSILTSFLGGRGFNVLTLFHRISRVTDPLAEDNVLVFGAGPLVGTNIPSNGRYNVSSRSPLTMLLGDSNSAGLWAVQLKKAGFDGIVIRGASERPVYLFISNEKCEIVDASFTWGKTVSETDRLLREKHGRDARVLSIGPAGENLVRYACIMNDRDRAAGRTGNGAVMGAKNLKAIIVSSQGKVATADPEAVRTVSKEIRQAMRASPSFQVRSEYGTPMLTTLYNHMGVLPTRNNQTGIFSSAEKIGGERLKAEYVETPKSCFLCPVHCSRRSVIKKGKYAGLSFEGPEFESICSLGSRLDNDDLESILYLNKRLNDLGLDTISTGGTIAYAMECFEKGLLHEQDLDGLDLTWGNTESIITMVEWIAYRKGFGDILAEGVKRGSEKIAGSERYALHVKGMEVPTQEVRGLKAWGLGWAVSSRGADHCRAFPVMETTWTPEQAEEFFGTPNASDRLSYESKAAMVKWAEDYGAVIDALGLCTISYIAMGLKPELVAGAYRAVTGLDVDTDELLKAGERINNLERLLNLNLGLHPVQDTLPDRFLEEPLPEGPCQGEVIRVQGMIDEYYALRGWCPTTGRPGKDKLKALGLNRLPLNGF